MTEQVRARIFEPFFTTRPDRGSGLGLGVVSKLISLYGGELQVETAFGSGSTFTVHLPLGPAESKKSERVSPSIHP